jgi:hypothetical protein
MGTCTVNEQDDATHQGAHPDLGFELGKHLLLTLTVTTGSDCLEAAL